MKTYEFVHKNGDAVIIITSMSFEAASLELVALTKHYLEWRCDNEDGEDLNFINE